MKRALLMICLLTATAVHSETINYQEELVKEETRIDKAVVQAGGTIAEKLSAKYNLTPEELQKYKDEQKSWGRTVIMFSFAKELKRVHPQEAPTFDDALKKVRDLIVENKKYDEVGTTLKLELLPVLAEAQHQRQELQNEKRRHQPTPNVP